MKTKRKTLWGLLIVALGFSLILGGCSQFNPDGNSNVNESIIAPSSSSSFVPPLFDLTRYEYPEAANYPPEGYEFIHLGINASSRTITDGSNSFASEYVETDDDEEIFLDDIETGIEIEEDGVPYDTWIMVTRPNEEEPWVEFEPHGLVFTSSQLARISWEDCGLPPGMDPDELTVLYFNVELNVYEDMGGVSYPEKKYIEYDIDHFSRYVIARNE